MGMGRSKPKVTIVECGPRDGLAAIPGPISVSDKVLLINSLVKAGLKKIDCVAFTHPRLLPENADAEEVMQRIEKKAGVTYIGLAPSEIGCRRAIGANIDEILVLVAASEAFNKAALGWSVREVLNKTLPTIAETAAQNGKSIRGYVLAAFGCPYSGKVSFERISEIVSRLALIGAKEISLVDSAGTAIPKQVTGIVTRLAQLHPDINLAVHFHDTRGTALANCLAAYEAGVRIFDTAVGGLSGTPFGAPELEIGFWNVPTEDLVHLFKQMGVHTGVQLDRLLKTVELAEKLAGRALPGHILRAGPSSEPAKLPEPLQLK
jgi:hydroxymethylglutaryl-CoA lyase